MERYPKMPTETMPRSGKVSEVVQEWLVKEDGALASRLQDEEITEHYQQNRLRNGVIRSDAPRARSEQMKEDEQAAYQQALQEQQLYEQYAADMDVARRLALQAETEEDARRSRQERDDFELAARLQEEERQRRRQQREERQVQHEARLLGLEAPVRELRLTEPPGAERVYPDDDLSDLMAPPPLHGQPLSEDDVRSWQEDQDEEVARLLQEQETKRRGDVMPRDKVAAIEAQDRELAKVLQEQERARLRRAKERAKEKRRQRQQRERQATAAAGGSGDDLSADSAAETGVLKVRGAEGECCRPRDTSSPLPSPAELRQRAGQSQPEPRPWGAPSQPEVRHRAGPSQPEIRHRPGPSQPEIRQRPGPSQPEVRHRAGPSQPEMRPWGAPSQPEVRSRGGVSPPRVCRPAAGRSQASPLPPLPPGGAAGVSNIAMVIDPTYQRRQAAEQQQQQPAAVPAEPPQPAVEPDQLSDDLYEEEELAPPYMPIQGQRRTNSMEKARRRRGKEGANCKQQ